MCRWIAYTGPVIPMSIALIDAKHSLLVQSERSTMGEEPMNGDGFGIGWYSDHLETPGVFRDVRPAWNDDNFRDLAAHIRSGMFLAHIRATTVTAVQRSNCHPFRHGRWLFQHNGLIPDFHLLRRDLMFEVGEEYFDGIQGSTDSEVIFHLALTFGLEDDAPVALTRTVATIEETMKRHGVEDEFQFSATAANGQSIYAVRYASRGTPRTLFYATDLGVLRELDPALGAIPEGSIVVVSEPLGPTVHWEEVPAGTIIRAGQGGVDIGPFRPA
jgi:predicted glutamine amidotransferase